MENRRQRFLFFNYAAPRLGVMGRNGQQFCSRVRPTGNGPQRDLPLGVNPESRAPASPAWIVLGARTPGAGARRRPGAKAQHGLYSGAPSKEWHVRGLLKKNAIASSFLEKLYNIFLNVDYFKVAWARQVLILFKVVTRSRGRVSPPRIGGSEFYTIL